MALYSKKDFAEMCGMNTKKLSVYALPNRRKVIYSGDYVDDNIEPNKSFLAKWRDVKSVKIAEEPVKEPPSAKTVEKPVNLKPRPPVTSSPGSKDSLYQEQVKKARLQNEKTEHENDLLSIKKQQLMGKSVPLDLLRPVILQNNQAILIETKTMLDNVLSLWRRKYNIPIEEVTLQKKNNVIEVNNMITRASKSTIKSLNQIINEFAAKRGIGEHD